MEQGLWDHFSVYFRMPCGIGNSDTVTHSDAGLHAQSLPLSEIWVNKIVQGKVINHSVS
jgi:hypothetical protein